MLCYVILHCVLHFHTDAGHSFFTAPYFKSNVVLTINDYKTFVIHKTPSGKGQPNINVQSGIFQRFQANRTLPYLYLLEFFLTAEGDPNMDFYLLNPSGYKDDLRHLRPLTKTSFKLQLLLLQMQVNPFNSLFWPGLIILYCTTMSQFRPFFPINPPTESLREQCRHKGLSLGSVNETCFGVMNVNL